MVDLSRSAVLKVGAAALAVLALAAIGYRVARDFPGAPPPVVSRQAQQQGVPSGKPQSLAQENANPAPPASSAKGAAPSTAASSAERAAADQPKPADGAVAAPSFDIVRVERSGETVVAGRAAPHAKVTLVDKGAVVAQAEADASGQFAILPPPLPPGDHQLGLTASTNGRATASQQSVTVAVPNGGDGHLVVALTAPDQPTKVLADEAPTASVSRKAANVADGPAPVGATNSASAASGAQAFIQTVEVGRDGGFYATGTAKPRSHLQLYVNNSPVAAVTADAEGRWSLRVAHGLQPGSYSVRADEIDPQKGDVLSRAEVPFDFAGLPNGSRRSSPSQDKSLNSSARPAGKEEAQSSAMGHTPEQVSAAAAPAQGEAMDAAAISGSKQQRTTSGLLQPSANELGQSSASEPASTSNALVAELPTVVVSRGDNLWRISRKILGRGVRYTLIYEANVKQIRDRNLIYPGQIFVVPKT